MKYGKYKLPTGLVMGITIFFIIFYRFAPYSARMIVGSILCIIILITLIFFIIYRKKLKSKLVLPTTACMFLVGLIPLLDDYFQHNNINDKNIAVLIIPIVFLIFMRLVIALRLSNLNDDKEIKKAKRDRMLFTYVCVIVEIIGIYGVFIYHK